MSDKQKVEMYDETDELDVPYLPWLEEAQQQYYEETMGLTPEERAVYSAENDSPYLPWLEEAQRQIHEDRKGLTPEERGLYWANVRAEWAREAQQHRKRKQSQARRQPLPALQPAGAIAI